MYKIGNFSMSHQKTAFSVEGYYDAINFSAADLKSSTNFLQARKMCGKHKNPNYIWEFIICPSVGFLGNPEPLPKDCELKISFDRASPKTSVLKIGDTLKTEISEPFDIKDVVATTEYVSSPHWREYFSQISDRPLTFNFDECEVMIKNIPNGETEVRFDNIRGGNIPQCMFLGILPQNSLKGDTSVSSTQFKSQKVTQMNISLDGTSVNGYPLAIKNDSSIAPLQKFLDVTNRYYNIQAGDCVDLQEFPYNWIWSHAFESESSGQGWLSVDFKLSSAYSTNMALVCWIIYPSCITIDKFNQVERINL